MTKEEILQNIETENKELDLLVNKHSAEAKNERIRAEAEAQENRRTMMMLQEKRKARADAWKHFWGIWRNVVYVVALFVLFWAAGIAFSSAMIAENIYMGAKVVLVGLIVVCFYCLGNHVCDYIDCNKKLSGPEGAKDGR